MITLDLPLQSPLQKTLIRRSSNNSRDVESSHTVIATNYLMPVKLSGSLLCTNAEASLILDAYRKAGSEPVLVDDITDNTATKERKFDGYGGWTQGVFIWSAYPESGFFAKVYSLIGSGNPDRDPTYIRPIASVRNAKLFLDPNTESFLTATWNPYTQLADFAGYTSQSRAQRSQSFRDQFLALTPNESFIACAASFDFSQAYMIEELKEMPGDTAPRLLDYNTHNRKFSFSIIEKNINTLAWFKMFVIPDNIKANNSYPNE